MSEFPAGVEFVPAPFFGFKVGGQHVLGWTLRGPVVLDVNSSMPNQLGIGVKVDWAPGL